MKTIEQVEQEHAVQLANLKQEHAIAGTLPLPPDSVMLTGKSAPWIAYKAPDMRAALSVFETFTASNRVLNIEHATGTFTHLCPASERGERYKDAEVRGDYAALIRVHQGEGFGPSVTLTFFAEVAARTVRINVDLADLRGWKYGARADVTRDRADRIIARKYLPNNALNGYADKIVSYGSSEHGPIKKSADIVYLFVADDGQDCTTFSHLVGQLTNIADEFDPKAPT